MSCTEIVVFTKSGRAKRLADVRNAWRGAMAVWNIMDERYLPAYTPEWARGMPNQKERYSRMSDPIESKKVWDLFVNEKVSMVDRICMGSTLDWCVVLRKNIPELIDAFRKFEGESSLKEQADIIEAAFKDKKYIGVAWNQTSVCENKWNYYKDRGDTSIAYNLLKDKEHWSLFEEESILTP